MKCIGCFLTCMPNCMMYFWTLLKRFKYRTIWKKKLYEKKGSMFIFLSLGWSYKINITCFALITLDADLSKRPLWEFFKFISSPKWLLLWSLEIAWNRPLSKGRKVTLNLLSIKIKTEILSALRIDTSLQTLLLK